MGANNRNLPTTMRELDEVIARTGPKLRKEAAQRPNLTAAAICMMISTVIGLCCAMAAFAQTTPTPAPTNPVQPNPQSKSGATIVINPTDEECKHGWNPSLKWTKEQFDQFCAKLGTSK
jgi:hypothetical protein